MFFRGVSCEAETLRSVSSTALIFAGGCWGLVIFTRVNVGIVLVVSIMFLWIIVEAFIPTARNVMRHLIFGVLLSIALVVSALILTSSLTQWWNQAIVWPATWSSTIYSRSGMFFRFESMFETMSFEVLIALIAIYFLGGVSAIHNKNRIVFQSLVVTLSSGLMFLFAWSGTPMIWAAGNIPQNLIKFANLRLNLLSLFFWLGMVTSLLVLVVEILKLTKNRPNFARSAVWVVFLFVATSGTIQILPVSDSRHFWWGMPLIIVVLFHYVSDVVTSSWIRYVSFAVPTILLVVAIFQLVPGYLQISRTSAPAGSVAEGMLIRSDKNLGTSEYDTYLANFELLSSTMRSTDRVVFIVRNGDVSVFDGQFHSVDRNYVSWGPVEPFIPRVKNANLVVLDVDAVSAFQPEMYNMGFEPVAKNDSLAIWRKLE
jgi:hypothetical protein